MTPDGVSTEDWDRVHELAVEIVNTSAEDEAAEDEAAESEAASLRMRELLDDLQEKYGPLPSILATRADYVDDLADREYWLQAAHEQARLRGDAKNLAWIASSLAALHLETAPDPVKGAEWLSLLEEHLNNSPRPRRQRPLSAFAAFSRA